MGVAFGPLMAVAGAGAALAGSTGLISATTASVIGMGATLGGVAAGVIGSQGQARGYSTAGQIAVAQAKADQERAAAIAEGKYQEANADEAAAQRKGIQDLEIGDVAAGRAAAVMAASGAGLDPKLLAAIKGKANYNAAVDRWTGADKARVARNEGVLTTWSAEVGADQAFATQRAYEERASLTRDMGWANAGLTLASKYGVPGGGGGFTPDRSTTDSGAWDIGKAALTGVTPTIVDSVA